MRREGVRTLRRDAVMNRRRVLEAAVVAVRRDGLKVPMATIAHDAGIAVGTLYRHFPTREDLFAGLIERSFGLVLEDARAAVAHDGPPLEAVGVFIELTIVHRAELVLPLHGAPVIPSPAIDELRATKPSG